MTYVAPTWVDVPPDTTPPAGAPALDAAHMQDISDALEELDSGGSLKYLPRPTGSPVVGKVPTVTALVPLTLDWETPAGAGGAVTSVAGRTGAVSLTKTDVGLTNVDNTSDVNKPVSTAASAAMALLAPLASPALTGAPTAPTPSVGDSSTKIATTAFVQSNAQSATQVVAQAYAATVTPAVNTGQRQILNIGTLTGALTLANPTGSPTDGQRLQIRFVQDSTGRAISFGTAYAFGTDVTTSLIPTTANAKFEMLFQWNATDSKWRAMSIVRGF